MDEFWSRFAALRARLDASGFGDAWRRLSAGALGDASRQLARRIAAVWRRGTDPVRPAVGTASTAARQVGDAVRPGTPPILYTDGMVTLDHRGVVVSSYYLPFGRRRIPYGRIRAVGEYPLSRGRAFRVHGFGWPRQWYHRDSRRAERSVGLELVTDDLLHPVLTPVDVDAVREILDEHIPRDRPTPERPRA